MEFKIKTIKFKLIENHKECFEQEAFEERYAHVLDKYDYILGDYSAEMLRLKGFYKDDTKLNTEYKFKNIKRFLNNSCAFDCPYFLIKKVKGK